MRGKQVYGVPDAENPEWTTEEIRTAKPFAEVFPDLAAREIRRASRGPQKTPTKQPVSLRVDPEVLAAYRATGAGWQGRMHAVLAAHAPRRAKAAPTPRARRATRRVRRAS